MELSEQAGGRIQNLSSNDSSAIYIYIYVYAKWQLADARGVTELLLCAQNIYFQSVIGG